MKSYSMKVIAKPSTFPPSDMKNIGILSEKEARTQGISGVRSSSVCQSFCPMFTDPFSF